jgi:N-methylhydantoinase A/oxoprolinase/acetone carboxylase beta subunit
MPRASLLIGIDTGGTFTDFVCFGANGLRVHKRRSTPDDPARAVLAGLAELLEPPSGGAGRRSRLPSPVSRRITYGSTVATNAVLERKGARVVLLATAGFEDVIEIGRQTRPDLYALEPRKPAPLVGRAARVGVAERLAADGAVLDRLRPAELRRIRTAVRRHRPQSIAVCLLNAYANGEHERALGRALATLGVPLTLSHELIGEYREYERTSTTVMNAYVVPLMRRHLDEVQRGVGRARLRVMQSSGGAISAATAGREAVRTLLSGPAGGAIGALVAARRCGIRRVISFDMGGTSTDVSLLDGAVRHHTEWTIGELPVKVPAIDIHTVGAGGGSIAARDPGGALKVGPESAGAEPGPACYGRGEYPTVTDANLLLGRLVPEAFLGGRMALDVARARRAVAALARAMRLDVEHTAEGIVRVVNAAMERAVRRISLERGHDPRDYTLVAFGGAAAMHACELASGLGIRRMLVPLHPGLLSAWGALVADVQRDVVRTVRLHDPEPRDLAARLRPLAAGVRRALRAEGVASAGIRVHASLDVRYRGQSFELNVPMRAGYRQAFHAAHRAAYGYADPQRPLEVVNLRVIATAPSVDATHAAAPIPAPAASSGRGGGSARGQPHRLRWNGRWLRAQRYDRASLPRRPLRGPLIITELSATTLVPPGWTARLAPSGDLLLEWS